MKMIVQKRQQGKAKEPSLLTLWSVRSVIYSILEQIHVFPRIVTCVAEFVGA